MKAGAKEGICVVPSHESGKVLTSKYLKDLETSVKARTPVAGTNIGILYVEGSAIISVTGTLAGAGKPIELTVCSNGTPSVITVMSYNP